MKTIEEIIKCKCGSNSFNKDLKCTECSKPLKTGIVINTNERDKVCKHKFDFGLGGKGSKTSRHCGKCDHWEDVPNEKKS